MHHSENERIKRAYFFYLKEARRLGEHSVDCAAAALAKFEDYTKFRDFKRFHIQQAIGFKRMLSDQISLRTGERLSRGTVFSTLNALRGFFLWLATQPGYRSHLTPVDAEYFSLSDKEARIAKAALDRPVPTIEQIRHVLKSMPADSDVELRNRAVVAFTLLTGARDGAIASLKVKHVDILGNKVEQDAREVRTKFSKTFTTWFFPVGDDIRQIVVDWVGYLTAEMLFGPVDPLFPATRVVQDRDYQFQVGGLSRQRHAYQDDLQRVIYRRRPAVRKSTFLSQDTGAARRAPLSDPRGIQSLEPEPRARAGTDYVFELWPGCGRPTGRIDPASCAERGERHAQGRDDRPGDPALGG
jgi:site-specific recombinase XerD